LNGVSCYEGWFSLQFISLDGTRSAFDSSGVKWGYFTDHIIPQGKQIRKVETLLEKADGKLWGFKWIGDDGAVLLKVGNIDDPNMRNFTKRYSVTTLTLNHNQRLVGVRSGSRGRAGAWHYSF
jgi:hypothetical protein